MVKGRADGLRIAVAIIAAACVVASGCAGKRPPPEPILRLVVLPAERNDVLFPPRERNVEMSPMVGAVPYLILSAIEAQRRRTADELQLAISRVGFDPVARIDERVLGALEKAGVKYETTSHGAGEIFRARLNRDFTRIAGDADAVLDLRITQFGFYESSRAGGYSPMLGIRAHFWSTKSYAENGRIRKLIGTVRPSVATKTNPEIGSFQYWFDWRRDPGNPRWFTSGPDLIVPDLASIVDSRDKFRNQFEAVIDLMIERLVLDVKSRMVGSHQFELPGSASGPELSPD